jgi:hypothetical protein
MQAHMNISLKEVVDAKNHRVSVGRRRPWNFSCGQSLVRGKRPARRSLVLQGCCESDARGKRPFIPRRHRRCKGDP